MKKWLASAAILSVMSLTPQIALAGDRLWPDNTTTSQSTATSVQTDTPATILGDHPPSHWDIRSSVQVSRDALRDAYEASRSAYTKKLQKYAKCSPREAKEAVSKAHPGLKIENLQLRNIRTSLVYVAFAEDDEDKFLVIVDAGDGKILLDRPVPTHHERVFADH